MNRMRSMKERLDQEQRTSASLRPPVKVRSFKWILPATVLVQLVVTYGFAADPRIPQELRPQMWSGVELDPKLTGPFFDSDTWSYPRWISENPDGTFTSTRRGDKNPVKDPPRLKHTAELFCSSFGAGFVRTLDFCEARLLDGHTIQLFVDQTGGAFSDSLRLLIKDGRFTCQYWQVYNLFAYRWATKRQKLILDKESYRKGDTIKGRIDLECLMVPISPKYTWEHGQVPEAIKIFGVFKTTVE